MTALQAVPGVRLEDVRVGERARKDYGDLDALKNSIGEHGLLQPIVLLPDDYLLCGGRRLEACRQLGWEAIPFIRVAEQGDAISRLKAERDENTCRKDMTPSELVAIGLKLEELKRPQTLDRQRQGGALGGSSFSSGEQKLDGDAAVTRREVAQAVGMSESAYSRAKRVVEAAEDPALPDDVRQVAVEAQADMDSGRSSISAAEHKVKSAKLASSPPRRLPELERLDQIRAIADTGRTSAQIGEEIGLGEEQVRAIARRHNVEITADKVMARTHRVKVDHNHVVSHAVMTLEVLVDGLRRVDYDELDDTQLKDWAVSLSKSLPALRTFISRIKEMAQ